MRICFTLWSKDQPDYAPITQYCPDNAGTAISACHDTQFRHMPMNNQPDNQQHVQQEQQRQPEQPGQNSTQASQFRQPDQQPIQSSQVPRQPEQPEQPRMHMQQPQQPQQPQQNIQPQQNSTRSHFQQPEQQHIQSSQQNGNVQSVRLFILFFPICNINTRPGKRHNGRRIWHASQRIKLVMQQTEHGKKPIGHGNKLNERRNKLLN